MISTREGILFNLLLLLLLLLLLQTLSNIFSPS
jgi:hypothetical protein